MTHAEALALAKEALEAVLHDNRTPTHVLSVSTLIGVNEALAALQAAPAGEEDEELGQLIEEGPTQDMGKPNGWGRIEITFLDGEEDRYKAEPANAFVDIARGPTLIETLKALSSDLRATLAPPAEAGREGPK